ncbi:hypothetical protein BJX96DRAFT_58504 [Aspergillus floccosus]
MIQHSGSWRAIEAGFPFKSVPYLDFSVYLDQNEIIADIDIVTVNGAQFLEAGDVMADVYIRSAVENEAITQWMTVNGCHSGYHRCIWVSLAFLVILVATIIATFVP